jgi:hypothetical protein
VKQTDGQTVVHVYHNTSRKDGRIKLQDNTCNMDINIMITGMVY